jgi:2,4-diaminopentanoate dehydrogenase
MTGEASAAGGPGPSATPDGSVRVTLVGLGAIGREVLRALGDKRSVRVVAAADPAFVGQDAGLVAGLPPLGLPVASGLGEALAVPSDVALVLTTSATVEMLPVVDAAGAAGVDVISSCEDLAFAPLGAPDVAAELDARARAAGISVLGTGVNPGFVMDRLPLVLAGACVTVRRVTVRRVVDAALRRAPLRAKVGAGLTVAAFEAGVAARILGHRGLPESCALVGAGLGLTFDEIRTTIVPVVATSAEPRAGIAAGQVAGLRQTAVGLQAGVALVSLDLEMSVAAPDPHDRVVIDGDPPLDVRIAGGTHGDRGTVGTIINAIPAVLAAPPGLRTVSDLPLYGYVI